MPQEGRRRAVIEGVEPQIDGGRYPAKRVIGDRVRVEADVFGDGHDEPSCALLWRHESEDTWHEEPMEFVGNDRWRADFHLEQLGRYHFTVSGWLDHFKTWRHDLEKRVDAGQEIDVDLRIGAAMVEDAAERARAGGVKDDAGALSELAALLADSSVSQDERAARALGPVLQELMSNWPDREFAERYEPELTIEVDRKRARFSSWYEMFPRSASAEPGEHGTFRDCEDRLPYIAEMGFDVVYFPPIHPIGRVHRKGKNNATVAAEGDVGSPWAIGSSEGGHKAVHPDLGTLEDFRRLVERAKEFDIEIALDIAFQAAPDHPYVEEHPEWFKERPDGTIQYAENPPKKYEDIYPFDFETDNWQALWEELESVVRHWCEQGVRVFRVDNPHTKPFAMWEWLIASIKEDYPEAIFLSEAFTRPKVMQRLAKLGFSQSYTYFAWRNTKWELSEYLRELTHTEQVEFMRPNFWPNTPDILTEFLQTGKRSAFMMRVALAATMTANYGIYGPAFELMEHVPRHPGSEEYLDSEKYQLRDWDLDAAHSLKDYIARLNRIRKANPALQQNRHTAFHRAENDWVLAFSKRTRDRDNVILTVANLDPDHKQAAMLDLDLAELGLAPDKAFQVHDLIDDARYVWQGHRNYVELDPHVSPVHVFRIGQKLRSERDFDYYT
ncbi:alpha-1,4-glucan--maltose-1-phosphate maltosyltransferase [Persicimonas caeni]|nr:alpha-1,4-glucan--maltose-1-phosphate maltosyltransferase [Persicimonas caeni]